MPAIGAGHVGATPVAVLQGRAHYYERGRADEMKGPFAPWRPLGCETVLLTNAAGSLRLDMPPGSPMVISDHINFTGANPLFGEAAGSDRFVDMVDAYDPKLVAQMLSVARAANIICHDGVYIWFCGPSFETPAEIRAARTLGADAVGMSTVPETILARQAGMKVVAVSLMTTSRQASRTTSSATSRPWPWHATRRARCNVCCALFWRITGKRLSHAAWPGLMRTIRAHI